MITLSMNFMKTITGHFYELIDYYWYLSNFTKVQIRLFTDVDLDLIKKAISSKYLFEYEDLNISIEREIPKIIKGDILLQVDGRFDENRIYHFDKIFAFRCSPRFKYFPKKAVILQDHRIYDDLEGTQYIKKVAISIQKKPKPLSENRFLFYLTASRHYDISKIPLEPKLILKENEILDNFFEQFTTYVYTPTEHNFDCSSRLLVECKYYGKNVLFFLEEKDMNKGLEIRIKDIEHNVNDLLLTKEDELWQILNTCTK